MVSPERLDLMQRQWVRLLDPFGVTASAAYPVFDALVAAYTEPHRHYHNLEHLGEMFRVVARLPVENAGAVYLAIWFHDVVYNPQSKDNEARSAAFAVEQLTRVGIPADVSDRVSRLILATAHLTDSEPPTDLDTAALLDADLAILGASEARYQRYSSDIRKEYAWVPEEAYRAGRGAVLRQFLGRERIYHTALMHDEGDGAARRNLARELEFLSEPEA